MNQPLAYMLISAESSTTHLPSDHLTLAWREAPRFGAVFLLLLLVLLFTSNLCATSRLCVRSAIIKTVVHTTHSELQVKCVTDYGFPSVGSRVTGTKVPLKRV